MNIKCLIDEGLLTETDDGIYMNENLKTILTYHNAMNPERPVKLGTLRTYADRHHWIKRSMQGINEMPEEDDYN